jgi:hypothetical protein
MHSRARIWRSDSGVPSTKPSERLKIIGAADHELTE